MPRQAPNHWLVRSAFLRALGLVYTVAFLVIHLQFLPLLGSHGLEPAALYLARLAPHVSALKLPTVFWLDASDAAFGWLGALGLALSWLVLCGVENALVMFVLWALYLSFVHVGQDFYGYGWEILLLEAGFLAIFLCPVKTLGALANRSAPPLPVIFMLRWLLFRVMFGAGLIKVRGDACWRDLSCLAYHYETQPNPSPMSWLLHQAPLGFHQLGVLWNHWVELIAPWLIFGPRPLRLLAGTCIVVFQLMLIVSGNLSFLNWLTLAVAIACFDDAALSKLVPRALLRHFEARAAAASTGKLQRAVVAVLTLVVVVRSYGPIDNMASPSQRMNDSFDPLHLVNTYGAFGSVGRERDEVIIEGTHDRVVGPDTRWLEYELPCKPGDVLRPPCLITPYHYRLDWQLWFAALGDPSSEPFTVSLVDKLLRGEPATLRLFARNPFPDAPPKLVRMERYRYQFTKLGSGERGWWTRRRLGAYLPPLAAGDPRVRAFLVEQGWVADGP